jgi:hypothetical protein
MAIVSEASPDELCSPFYKKNMEICLSWESFIKELGGTSRGSVTAWAYLVQGQIKAGLTWKIKVSKSHYTNSRWHAGFNVIELLEISTFLPYVGAQEFTIRRSYLFDLFKRKKRLKVNRKYYLFGEPHPIVEYLIPFLNEALTSNQVNFIRLKDNELNISLDTYNNNFDFVKQLITSIKS